MIFDYVPMAALSKLAWCVVITDNKTIKVYHGSGIETREDGFIEGAWDGEFEAFEFDQADFLNGSGGRITQTGDVIFATPGHTLERLYSIKEADALYLSNSMPLILVLSKHRLLPEYTHYERDLSSILLGLPHYTRHIPLDHGVKLHLHYYTNLKLENNSLIEHAKPTIEPFTNYDDYYGRLKHSLQQIFDNAKSSDRHSTYGLMTTISSGYDAACCSAIVKDMGCVKAVTFDSPESYASDSGLEMAEYLNYDHVITKNAYDYLEKEDFLEAEFVSSGELGTGIVFTAFEEEFAGNIIIVGERGDYMWGKNERSNNDFIFEDNIFPGTSMIEHRLRIGYMFLPLPMFGAAQWESIRAITLSDEMKPYTIGGNYCRPIARKILEDAGVPRESFGIKKQGVGFNYHYDNLTRLQKRMSPHSFKQFERYYKRHQRPFYSDIPQWAEFVWDSRHAYSSYFISRLFPSVERRYKESLVSNPGPPSYLFPWGVETMVDQLSDRIKI